MIKNIFPLAKQARIKLTRLGRVVFYLYIILALVGCVGMVFAIINIIMKLGQFGPTIGTSYWEMLALIIVAWFMAKIFFRESLLMLDITGLQKPRKIKMVDEPTPAQQTNAKVLPFVRKK